MLYDYILKDYKGQDVNLTDFKGKVLLVVNTATKCGFTPQYEELMALYDRHHDKGFEILDFPCNQFLKQAPGTSQEIHDSCVLRWRIKFPQFEKIDVNGKNEHPFYRYLKDNSPVSSGKRIAWNFTKFLIDRNGNIVNRYEPPFKPLEIESDILKLL
ncbi:MAG TPA: glutathione peroxidase [Bacilli bacterium]|jgi:glutathione peroxidase|nr:glutathione peroxidase [Bacilli bacterium]HPY80177.1 glutathione peroxidase [Bacilli bacterium]